MTCTHFDRKFNTEIIMIPLLMLRGSNSNHFARDLRIYFCGICLIEKLFTLRSIAAGCGDPNRFIELFKWLLEEKFKVTRPLDRSIINYY